MCRNTKTLFKFAPPATEAAMRAAARRFLRKLSGFNAPSKANQLAFERTIREVTAAAGPEYLVMQNRARPIALGL